MSSRSTFNAAAIATALVSGAISWPSAAAAAPAPPVISATGTVCTDTGLELTFHVDAPSDVTPTDATITAFDGSAAGTVTSFHLVSGTDRSGTWQSAGPLGLSTYGAYTFQVHLADSDDLTATSDSQFLPYQLSPMFHDVVWTPTTLDHEHPLLTVTGRLTTYDPATGDTGTAWAKTTTSVNVDGPGGPWYPTPIQPDGTFKLSRDPGPVHVATYALTTSNGQCSSPTSPPINSVVSNARITLDRPAVTGLVEGQHVTFSGIAQEQQPDGQWTPLAREVLNLTYDRTHAGQLTTDASGRFTYTGSATPGNHGYEISTQSLYLTPTTAGFSVQANSKVLLAGQQAAVDADSRLNIKGFFESPFMPVPQGRVYIQQSNDGRTGWTTIGSVALKTSDPGDSTGIAYTSASGIHVTNPHGYWRYYYPGAVGYTAAYSEVLHAFRYETAISGGRPSATSVLRNHRTTINGTLHERGYGSWVCLPKVKVSILFRPSGSTTWHTITTAWTDSKGHFSASPQITRSGTWRAVYWAADQTHVNAYGPAVWVTAR